QTGKRILTLQGHTGEVTSVAFSANGKRIVSGGESSFESGEVRVWDAQTGQVVFTLKGHTNRVISVAFSADGKRIVSGGKGRGEVKVWDAQSGQEMFSLSEDTGGVTCVAFSADGKRIVSGSWSYDPMTFQRLSEVKVWDAQTKQVTLRFKRQREVVYSMA